MNAAPAISVEVVTGAAGAQQARSVREAVFVHEQGIAPELEWDGSDAGAWHAIARAADGTAVGTARLLPCGQIGRMAVLRPWRGQGIGRALLEALQAQAAQAGMHAIFLHAQRDAIGFYARHGFRAVGAPFIEAGISHQRMEQPCIRHGD